MTSKETLRALIVGIANDLRASVNAIEGRSATTQNHYGAYLGILTQFPSKFEKRIVALALVEAGANRAGVVSALDLST